MKRPVWVERLGGLVVTPHVGVWIETLLYRFFLWQNQVTPHVGVWIETVLVTFASSDFYVTPHVGVWIETETRDIVRGSVEGHSPRGSVD